MLYGLILTVYLLPACFKENVSFPPLPSLVLSFLLFFLFYTLEVRFLCAGSFCPAREALISSCKSCQSVRLKLIPGMSRTPFPRVNRKKPIKVDLARKIATAPHNGRKIKGKQNQNARVPVCCFWGAMSESSRLSCSLEALRLGPLISHTSSWRISGSEAGRLGCQDQQTQQRSVIFLQGSSITQIVCFLHTV